LDDLVPVKPGLLEEADHGGNGIETCMGEEYALVPVLLVLPSERAIAVDHTEDKWCAGLRDPERFGEGPEDIVEETDGGHHRHEVKGTIAERKLLGNADHGRYSPFAGHERHVRG